ncbi:hypothetical protein C8R43DRAFT_885901 [Mycena crocata]|nr:hypothetical protein C8R43DRAFT_885901 [Mycena crocata]
MAPLPSGPRFLLNAFDCILKRGSKVKESTIFSRKYSTEMSSRSFKSSFERMNILVNIGRGVFDPLRGPCGPLSAEIQRHNDKTFWKIIFSIEIHFGLTEFRARIKWIDNVRLPILKVKFGVLTIYRREK